MDIIYRFNWVDLILTGSVLLGLWVYLHPIDTNDKTKEDKEYTKVQNFFTKFWAVFSLLMLILKWYFEISHYFHSN